jgi:CBS domain-containing protein
MSVQRDLEAERVEHLDLLPFLAVPIGTRVSEVLARMREERQNCALVTDGDGRLVGIFTERDVLHKVATKPESLSLHVEALMTPDPDTVTPEDRVAAALRFMNRGHYRHVPVVDREGRIVGNLRDYAIIRFLSDRLPDTIYNRAPDDQVAKAPEGA